MRGNAVLIVSKKKTNVFKVQKVFCNVQFFQFFYETSILNSSMANVFITIYCEYFGSGDNDMANQLHLKRLRISISYE
jgi:hypothetical protein